jgi:hypothetical protein
MRNASINLEQCLESLSCWNDYSIDTFSLENSNTWFCKISRYINLYIISLICINGPGSYLRNNPSLLMYKKLLCAKQYRTLQYVQATCKTLQFLLLSRSAAVRIMTFLQTPSTNRKPRWRSSVMFRAMFVCQDAMELLRLNRSRTEEPTIYPIRSNKVYSNAHKNKVHSLDHDIQH